MPLPPAPRTDGPGIGVGGVISIFIFISPRGGHHGGGCWPIVMPTAPPPDLADSPRPDGALLKGDEPKYERMGSSE